jgi:hypothetical protein
MAKPEAVFIYIGTYPDEAAARADYDVVKDLHAVGAVGTYDAAVVTKDDAGKVHENKDEMATRHGAWGGAAVGALIGILFPPAIIATAAVGAASAGSAATCGAACPARMSRNSGRSSKALSQPTTLPPGPRKRESGAVSGCGVVVPGDRPFLKTVGGTIGRES